MDGSDIPSVAVGSEAGDLTAMCLGYLMKLKDVADAAIEGVLDDEPHAGTDARIRLKVEVAQRCQVTHEDLGAVLSGGDLDPDG